MDQDAKLDSPTPRSSSEIFENLRALAQSDGALHEISALVYRDRVVTVDLQEGRVTDDLLQEMAFFHAQGREREIAYLGVSSLSRAELTAMAKRLGTRHELALDAGGKITRRYLEDQGTGIFIIDPQGTVRFVREGFRPTLRESIRSMLSVLLKELNASLGSAPNPSVRYSCTSGVLAFNSSSTSSNSRVACLPCPKR